MTEHYPKNTEHGVLKFCARCGRLTGHFCWSGRVGACMEQHISAAKKKVAPKKRKRESAQGMLFEVPR